MSTRAIQITEMRLGISVLGVPLSGGYVRFKLAGTETLATVYQDKSKALEADNPIELDTNGRALVYADGTLKLEVYDGDPDDGGSLLWTWDNQKYKAPNANTSTKTANYTITSDDDMVLGDATSGALTFSLGPSVNYSFPLYIKKIDASANNITVSPDSGETIDGDSSLSLTTRNETLHIFPDGSDWWSVALTSVETAEDSDTVDSIHASATAQPNKLLALNASSELPADITGDADTVDGLDASATPTADMLTPLDGSALFPTAVLPAATTTAKGTVEIATAEEVRLETDTAKLITPANLGTIMELMGKNHYGLVMSNDIYDVNRDINITAGGCRAAGNGNFIYLPSEITKKTDANWAAGDNQGGFPSGVTLAHQMFYRVFIIHNPTSGVTDAGFDTSATAANLLSDATGYTEYAQIGWIWTHYTTMYVRQFHSDGDRTMYETGLLDTGSNFTLGGGLLTILAPPDTLAHILCKVSPTLFTWNHYAALWEVRQGNQAPSSSNFNISLYANSGGMQYSQGVYRDILVNEDSRIYQRCNCTTASTLYFELTTLGFTFLWGQ